MATNLPAEWHSDLVQFHDTFLGHFEAPAVYGITLHSASRAPGHALSEGAV
jgi:hypothetical protein